MHFHAIIARNVYPTISTADWILNSADYAVINWIWTDVDDESANDGTTVHYLCWWDFGNNRWHRKIGLTGQPENFFRPISLYSSYMGSQGYTKEVFDHWSVYLSLQNFLLKDISRTVWETDFKFGKGTGHTEFLMQIHKCKTISCQLFIFKTV